MRNLLFAIVLLAVTVGTASAQSTARSVSWQRFDADLTLQSDGSVAVVETQTISFQGTYQQGFRVIPTDRTTGITDISVAQVNAASQATPLSFTSTADASGVRITWNFPQITNATGTFALRYVAHGVTRVYSGGNQVDWNAVYADRAGPVAASTVTLHLPGDVQESAVISAIYDLPVGRLPRQVGSATLVDSRTLRFDIGSLPANTGAEVRAQVPAALLPGVAAPPWQAAADQADWLQQTVAPIGGFLVLLLSLAIVGGGGITLVLVWYSRVREPRVGPVPARLDQPPSDLAPPLAGTLIDGSADVRDTVAILIDLARRGVLSLKEEAGQFGSDVRVVLHRPTEDPSLEGYERVLLVALFGRGVSEGEVLLSHSRLRFAAAVPFLEQRLYEAVVAAGLFSTNPAVERKRFSTIGVTGIAVGLLLAVVPALLIGWVVPAVWLPGALVALLSVVMLWFSRKVPHRTMRGALEAARWRAFAAHLMEEPAATRTLGDASLAYAIAFGADREFLHRLESPTGSGTHAGSYGWGMGPEPVIFMPGGWYGGYGGNGGGRHSGGQGPGPVGVGGGTGGPSSWSDALADLLNAASGALSHGGGSGPWSGGGWGGGGGSGGGSGGFN
jgi:Predicted membrane protein (DUF2207)